MKLRRYLLHQVLILCCCSSFAQTVQMDFNGNAFNPSGTEDPTFIVFQDSTDASLVEYVAGVSDQAVYLDSSDGFRFPMELTNVMMASDVWYFQLRFKITTWGVGDGDRMLVNLKRGGTNTPPWFQLYANKSDDTKGQVVFRMSDRTNAIQQYAFYFNLDEWVNLSLTINFAEMYYTLSADNYFISANYEDFDHETFKTLNADTGNSLQEKQFYVGYYQGLKNNHLSSDSRYNNDYSGDLIIDELVISDEEPATDVSIYENALIKLTNHLNGTATLTNAEISSSTSQILSNYRDNYLEIKDVVNAYLMAYETNYEPLFYEDVRKLLYEDYDEFGWVTFNLQQDIHDNYFTNEHIHEVLGLKFEASEGFPGPVPDTTERVIDEVVLINGTYVADPGYNIKTLADDYGTFARRMTGLYVPPGEAITVTVPIELVGMGAEIVIGASTHDVSNKLGAKGLRRFPRIIKQYDIYQTTMTVANPFGGILYIYIPEGTDLGGVNISVSGAVKMPYFPMTSLKTGDIAEFKSRIESGEVLFAEVETDNFMFTAPLTYFYRDDIVETLEMWDKMWEAYQLYNGRPYPRHNAEHYIIDRMTKWNTLAGGYPMVMGSNNTPNIPWFWRNLGTNMMNILDFEYAIHDDKATYWHEMSHHNGLPTLWSEAECIVELAYVVVHHEAWGMPLDSAMKYSERGFYTRDEAIVDWVVMPGFRINEEMTKLQRQYQQRGYSKYVDIGAMYGWDSLGLINKVFYDQWTAMGGQVNDPDGFKIEDSEWHLASAHALNMNMSPLYHFWGEQPDESIMDSLNTYPRSKKVYLRLREIRDFIPKTVEEFQPYFDAHGPTSTSSQNYQPYQDALAGWNTNLLYDSIIMQIDSILYWYYDGDFDQDGYDFEVDCDDTDPAINPDGMTYDIEACSFYTFDGEELTTDGTYSATFTSVAGCDSLVTINLTMVTEFNETADIATCDSYEFDGNILTASGNYDATFMSKNGCDSLVTLNLTILESNAGVETLSTCSSYLWNGTKYTASGTYEDILTNASGCDSVATLNLTILESTSSLETTSTCVSYDWNGTTYTKSGVYRSYFTNSVGCDSTAVLDLTILNPTASEEIVVSCESYEWNGTTYNESGAYEAFFANAAGCDSTATLVLTILNSTSGEKAIAACSSYEWEGNIYTSSGSYEKTLTNAVGCDSTATLNLTILEPTFSEETVEACGSYDWNGVTYMTSGSYDELFSNAAGCDSTATLNLIILEATFSEETIEACESYVWNGVTYSASGSYDELFSNAAGCDSTATLNLTILEATSSEETIEACGSYEWNETTFSESGVYEKFFTNAAGCDSTAILNLNFLDDETCNPLGSNDFVKIAAFPNPTRDGNIQLSDDLIGNRYRIITISGKVLNEGILQTTGLFVSGEKGLYILQVFTNEGIKELKVIKQ